VPETELLKRLLSDAEVVNALWSAAIATRLSPLATGRLSPFVEVARGFGTALLLPPWWRENIKLVRVPAPAVEGQQ
jgi:hypothetical protein